MITIKQYAESRNKSVQAVYQQIKRKENSVRLDGHIHISRVGNKDTKFLDDVAVEILDESSQKSVQIIEQTNDKEKIEELEKENKDLLTRYAALNDKFNVYRDRLEELTEKYHQLELENTNMKMLLEVKQDQDEEPTVVVEPTEDVTATEVVEVSEVEQDQAVQDQEQVVQPKKKWWQFWK